MKHNLVALFLLAGVAWAQPTPYKSPDGVFTVTFPGPVSTMGNSIAQTMVDGGIYQVLHSPSFGNDPAGQLAVARRSEERLPGTKVKVIRAGKVQGLEVVRTGSMGRGSLKRLFVVNNTIYSLEATYGGTEPSAEARAFIDSFAFSGKVSAPAGNLEAGMDRSDQAALMNKVRGCAANLKNLATASEMFASDNGGRYPANLQQLVSGKYLGTLPKCSYSGNTNYTYQNTGRGFLINCTGHQHKDAGLPADYPRIDQGYQVWQAPNQPLRN